MLLLNFKVSLKDNKACSLGSPEGNAYDDDEQNNEVLLCNHDRTNNESQAYSHNLHHGCQNVAKDLPRVSM
jgi:hypothetical protein